MRHLQLFGDPTRGDAILDRVVHRAHRINLKGPSIRKRDAVTGDSDSLTTTKEK